MEPKDWLTLGGVVVTVGLGIYNLYIAQQNARIAQQSARRTSIVGAGTVSHGAQRFRT